MSNRGIWSNWTICVACGLLSILSGCRTANHAEAGGLVGAGFGGVVGSMIGARSGQAGTGALLGAMTGAVVGGLAGDAEDAREERDAAVAQAQYERHVAAQNSVSNLDLITMAQAGLSDQVIVNAVQTRGGRFDLSPSAIIDLKNRGVSDHVILSIQQYNSRAHVATTVYPTTTIVAPSRVVYVEPRPTIGVGFMVGPRPHYHGHGRYYGRYGHRW